MFTRYLILRIDRKNVQHGGKRATIICRNQEDSDQEAWILFLSPSFSETCKYNALEKLISKSKPYSLFLSLENIIEENEYVIPIYNFVLRNPLTQDRIVVPCNYYPNSTIIQEERERREK
jgi:hypothetical protein